MYTVIDIETTGGQARSHRVVEIAIVTLDEARIIDSWFTLINPGKFISPFITSLTGITNETVADAPTFEEVADVILERTEGKIFVAHNVNFDYGFVKNEFHDLGIKFERKKLCTVRLSRKIFPGFASYNLGALTSNLGIVIDHRHRALGDAMATARVLELLIRNDKKGFISHSLKRNSKEAILPPNLDKRVYEDLPEKPGVYYFHNARGKVVYVGKAKNIKSRIAGHFTGETPKCKRLFHQNIHDISYELTGNELIALLEESREIRRLWPEYNRTQKITTKNHGVYLYRDRNGYDRFAIAKTLQGAKPVASFRTFNECRNYLYDLVKEHHLCAKLSGLQKSPGACFDHKLGLCDGACAGEVPAEAYNERVHQALETLHEEKKTMAIVGHGRNGDERSVVLLEDGAYLGHGFVEADFAPRTVDDIKERIHAYPDNQDIQKIINGYLKQSNGDQIIYF